MNDNIDEMPCEKLPRNTTKIMYPDQGDGPTSFGPKLFARKYQIRDIAILTSRLLRAQVEHFCDYERLGDSNN